MAKTYVFLADGFEELEAVAPVDLMRRAGMDVVTVSVNPVLEVTGAHGVTVKADALVADTDFSGAELLVAPGGVPGAPNLYGCARVREAFMAQNARGGLVAAICAAPAVLLSQLGITKGHKATCYPGFEQMLAEAGAEYVNEPCVVSGNVITANGPASAMKFALTAIGEARGAETARQVAAKLLLQV